MSAKKPVQVDNQESLIPHEEQKRREISRTGEEGLPRQDDILRVDKTFRIAVTGDVFLTKLEKEIVNTPDFQRLRGVRQLGTVYLVYPTALHTRFDHSLGTLAMADRMIEAIRNNTASSEEERQVSPMQRALARLYGLLHDLPHVPYGHTIEDELRLFQRHDENPGRINRFLGPDSTIAQLICSHLSSEAYDRFMAIYLWDDDPKVREERKAERTADGKKENPWKPLQRWLDMGHDDLFVHDLVSNTVCADLLDYIARDNYFCNLGITLEYRFLNFLYLHVPDGSTTGKRRVFVRLWKGRQHTPRRDTLTDLARLLEARYMIAERAYFHHAKIVSGVMLGRALQESAGAQELTEEGLYSQSDDSILRILLGSQAPIAQSLGSRVQERRLFKKIEQFGDRAFQQAQGNDHEKTFRETALKSLSDPIERKRVEDEISEQIGAPPGSVLIYAPPFNMNNKVARMNVKWKGVDMRFCDIDDEIIAPRLNEILKAHQMLWSIWVIGDPELSEEQKELVIEAFKIKYLETTDRREKRRLKYIERLAMNQMIQDDLRLDVTSRDFKKRMLAVATEYLTTATDKRPHQARLRGAISKQFKSSGNT